MPRAINLIYLKVVPRPGPYIKHIELTITDRTWHRTHQTNCRQTIWVGTAIPDFLDFEQRTNCRFWIL